MLKVLAFPGISTFYEGALEGWLNFKNQRKELFESLMESLFPSQSLLRGHSPLYPATRGPSPEGKNLLPHCIDQCTEVVLCLKDLVERRVIFVPRTT